MKIRPFFLFHIAKTGVITENLHLFMPEESIPFFELTFSELVELFKRRHGRGKYHASAMFRHIYETGDLDFGKADEFQKSPGFLSTLKGETDLRTDPVVRVQKEMELIKFVTRLRDGREVESVIVPMATHHTLCISSQVGCRMGCRFCETARLGLIRNLTVREIVEQVFIARFQFACDIRNLVFMGMGEPLDNLDNVIQAIQVFSDQRGFDIAKKYISVSTCGLVPGIEKLASLGWPQLNLAVSLNASDDKTRSRLMPVNNAWPMERLRDAMIRFPTKKNGAIYVEYVLIKGVNDSRRDATRLARYLRPIKAKLNLIAYNPRECSEFIVPEQRDVARFLQWMVDERVFVRTRSTKGRDIMAGCGQLGNRNIRKKQAEA